MDQFDNLEKHTQWGIDVLEKYIKFVKERTEIELNYAKQLRYTLFNVLDKMCQDVYYMNGVKTKQMNWEQQ
ncbi:UNVERIFIED_CONTAM: hypothetical protein K2H54_052623 [Gekko kuhli]